MITKQQFLERDAKSVASIAASAAASAVVALDIKYIKEEITEIKNKLDDQYVTQTEFRPVRTIVYGMVSLMLTGVVVALIALVIN